MKQYAALLDSMMHAIITGDVTPAHALLRDKQDFPADAQLSVYTEGYRIRLKDAVESAFPALADYLGKSTFSELAEEFIAAQPSRYFNLDKYPIAFARFFSQHCSDLFACELAALEGAIHDVYQREETPAIDTQWAVRQTPESLASTPLLPRAACCLLSFATPVDDYLSASRAGEKPSKPGTGESWLLVVRHKHQVRRLPLEQDEYALLTLLSEGLTLAQALEDERLAPYLSRGDFAASLQGWLARWVKEGVLRQPS